MHKQAERHAWHAGQKPKACTEYGGVDRSDEWNHAQCGDELRGLIEAKDLVGGLTEGSGVVSYRGSMR